LPESAVRTRTTRRIDRAVATTTRWTTSATSSTKMSTRISQKTRTWKRKRTTTTTILYEGLEFEDEGSTLPRRTAASNLDLELAIDEEDAAPLDFDDREDDAAEPEAGDRLSPRSAESSEERPLGRRRRRSRGGRRRNRGAGGGDSAGGGAPREAVARESHDRAPVRPRAEPVAAQRGGPSRSGDAMGLLREALGRVLQGSPRLVWGTVVLEAMQELDPSFHEGEPSFGSFEQLLEEAQRRGVLRLERSPATESYLVTAIASE
jgi:hypothetical protein